MTPTSGLVDDIKRRIYVFVLALAVPSLLLIWAYALMVNSSSAFLRFAPPPMTAVLAWVLVALVRRPSRLDVLEKVAMGAVYLFTLGALLTEALAPSSLPRGLGELSDFLVLTVAVSAFTVLPLRNALIASFALYAVDVIGTWAHLAATASPQAELMVMLVRHLALLAAIGLTSLLAWVRFWWGQTSVSSAHHARLANTDPLTNLPNRRGMYDVIEGAVSGTAAAPFSVVLADLDSFKSINDTFGHAAGDEVLRRFADTLRHALREGDQVGRWGGEEYLLVLRGTHLGEACHAAERLRATVERTVLLPDRAVTASFGVASWEHGDSFDSVLRRADAAMYRAKEDGKNRVACEEGREAFTDMLHAAPAVQL